MRRSIAVVVLVVGALAGCSGGGPSAVAGPEQRVTVTLGDAPRRGPADAPVVMVEFGDFQCPYCGDEEPVLARLLGDYDGLILFVFKQFPLSFHSHAQLAAEASLAANAQGAFWPFHDALYAHQDALTRADLEAYAGELGLDLDAFRAALDQGTYAAAVAADEAQGVALGVPGTPTLFINGRAAVGATPYADLKAVVDEELALAGR